MDKKKKTYEEEDMVLYKLRIMKAIGWYIDIHKDIKQKEIAQKMNMDCANISRSIISPKIADDVTDKNYLEYKKRLIDISRAVEICQHMDTTLVNILYYYQFKNKIYDMSKFDILEKLTNKLTDSEIEQDIITVMEDIDAEPMRPREKVAPNMLAHADSLVTNVDHPDFKPWFGRYYCYFSSTSSDEAGKKRPAHYVMASDDPEITELLDCALDDYIFCGIWNIYDCTKSKDGLCHVDFKFLANPEKRLIKRYSGLLTISAKTKAVFCELTSNEQGEKTYFILEKQDLGTEQPLIQCCMAMVLTYSSRVNRRRPCCERMIISRSKIEDGTEEYETMKSHLLMNDSIIRITEWGYGEMIKDIYQSSDPELIKIAESFPDIQSLSGNTVPIESCAFIPEDIIYKLHSLTDSQKQKFETLLRIHSIAPWYYKTKATKADIIFKLSNIRNE